MFIDHGYIYTLLEESKSAKPNEVIEVIDKAREGQKLSHRDVAILLQCKDNELLKYMAKVAGEIKENIYGKRVVTFAPLYISDYCINNCTYCEYRRDNKFKRKKLTLEEIRKETKKLSDLGHKRLALQCGEDYVNCSLEYILQSLDTICNSDFQKGKINKVSVNISASNCSQYDKLKEKNIGTYVLFQETYHKDTFKKVHPSSIKGNYEYHLNAFHRAANVGIKNLGGGILFGLYDYKFEIIALMMHEESLEKDFGFGFTNISMQRLKKSKRISLDDYSNLINDEDFKKAISIVRLGIPHVDIILSTQEDRRLRSDLLGCGVSQINESFYRDDISIEQDESYLGIYDDFSLEEVCEGKESKNIKNVLSDTSIEGLTHIELVKELLKEGYIPTECTACYSNCNEENSVFIDLNDKKEICNFNALICLMEYVLDYGDIELYEIANEVIEKEIIEIGNEEVRNILIEKIEQVKEGQRNITFFSIS